MRLYIIRHGDPDYEHDCLTSAGKVEAKALAEYLEYIGVDQIFSSPLGRAQETALYTSSRLGKDIQTLEWAKEHSGLNLVSDHFPSWDIAGHEVFSTEYLKDPGNWNLIKDFENVQLIRKAFSILVEKSDEFLSKLGYERNGSLYKITEKNKQKIAVFCHGGFGKTWLAHLLAIPVPIAWAGFLMHTSSITTILFEERKPGIACPRCIGFGEIPHLYHRKITPSKNGIFDESLLDN